MIVFWREWAKMCKSELGYQELEVDGEEKRK